MVVQGTKHGKSQQRLLGQMNAIIMRKAQAYIPQILRLV